MYGDIGVSRDKIEGWFSPGTELYEINEIPQVVDKSTGRVVSPVIRAPENFFVKIIDSTGKSKISPILIIDPDYWLYEILEAGATGIGFDSYDYQWDSN